MSDLKNNLTSSRENILSPYDFEFSPRHIAQKPATPRDSARLLVWDRAKQKEFWETFACLPDFLPEGAVLVLNETKVVPARLTLFKPTGGAVRVLYTGTERENWKIMADRKLEEGWTLKLDRGLSFKVFGQDEKYYFLKPSFPIVETFEILEKHGTAPIPPYIKGATLSKKRLQEAYQTVFAKERGSVAAPTASLHFTKRLLGKLRKRGVDIKFVTLHVGLGTFAPLTKSNLETGRLHEESYEIVPETAAFLNEAKKNKRPIVAVGTTVVRTLESACDFSGRLSRLRGETDLFIREGYSFKFVDAIITNFHVPQSSLLMLVSAFAGRERILELYSRAIEKNFKLFSFGDGMLIL
jgi:S-adenosylmethionine:tRNA ribosyltransferase-isomerase